MRSGFINFMRRSGVVAILLSLLTPVISPNLALATPPASLTGSSAVNGTNAGPIAITDLQISDTGNPTENIKLVVSHGSLSMTTTTGLTFTGGSTGAQLKFSGTLTNVNTALATLRYTRTDVGTDTLEVSLVGANQVYNPTNGHLYEYVTTDGSQTWTAAKTLADARTLGGATGYLATMTSTEENTYISDRLTGAGWMGASDAAVEGAWKWVDGPETGTQFWSGRAANYITPGSPVGGQFNAWNTGEPNDSSSNEDCGQFLSGTSGLWNDLPCTGSLLAGYVVEYGASGSLPQVASKSITLTTTGATHDVSTCAELQTLGGNAATRFDTINLTADIDCSGIANFTPMYTGTVFAGTLHGHSHKISHLTINHPGTDYQGLISHASGNIYDLMLMSGSVTGNQYVGGLVGEASNNFVASHVDSYIDVTGSYAVGGLVGSLYTSTAGSYAAIADGGSTGNVTSSGTYTGGLVGIVAADNSNVSFNRVYATGNVSATGDSAGGLIGFARAQATSGASTFSLRDAYTRGSVTDVGHARVGGLIGDVQSLSGGSFVAEVTVWDAYGSGALTGSSQIGGLFGYVYASANANSQVKLNYSFAAGHITAGVPSEAGGLVGYNDLASPYNITSTGNYYDGPGTGLSVCSTQHTALSSCTRIDTAITPNYFKSNHTNAPLNSWSFEPTWVVNPGTYPTFGYIDDGDGITTADENLGPNSGDANNDGTLDSLQANIASLPDPVSGHYAVLQSSCGALFNVQVGGESTQAGHTDVAYSYPGGLLKFVATGCTPGATATITQYFYGLATSSNFTMRKWNTTNNTYATISGAIFSDVTVGGTSALKAVYQVTDGSSLDQDGAVDGTIVDPAGPAVNVVAAPNTGLGGRRR